MLATKFERIEKFGFEGFSAAKPSLQRQLEKSLLSFQKHLMELGYEPEPGSRSITVMISRDLSGTPSTAITGSSWPRTFPRSPGWPSTPTPSTSSPPRPSPGTSEGLPVRPRRLFHMQLLDDPKMGKGLEVGSRRQELSAATWRTP